jgi:hypothetical protein
LTEWLAEELSLWTAGIDERSRFGESDVFVGRAAVAAEPIAVRTEHDKNLWL